MGQIDLHTHSTVSDGLLTPAELVYEAARRGIRVLALTDHETVAGLSEAETVAARVGIEFVLGVELNTDVDRHEVHILGYHVDRNDSDFVSALAILERQRVERIERIVDKVRSIGIPVEIDRVREIAGPGTIGRPHVARAMIELGYATDVADAFDRYLAAGRPGFVPRSRNEPETAVQTVRRGGGVPVLAHPLTAGDVESILRRLVPVGLLGIEVYYGEYETAVQDSLRRIADKWDLIPTGGSDYHGEGFKSGRDLGGPDVPSECVERLRTAAAGSRDREIRDSLPTAGS